MSQAHGLAGRRWLAAAAPLLLAVMLAVGAGCRSPLAKTSEAPSESQSTAVAVGDWKSGLEEARSALFEGYADFLEREPLEFDRETLQHVGPELSRAWGRASRAVDVFGLTGQPSQFAPIVLLVFFAAFLFLGDRRATRVGLRAQARIETSLWPWFEIWVRIAVLSVGRLAAPVTLLALSYFPVQAIFAGAGWTVSLTRLLWLLVAYRALHSAGVGVLGLGLVQVPEDHVSRLETFWVWSLRLIFIFAGLVALAETLGVSADVRAFLLFAWEIALLGVPVYLSLLRPSVGFLFPEPDEPGFYERIRRTFLKNYFAILGVSFVLLGLRAAGYVNASTFVLVRGYALFVLVLVTISGGSRVRKWFAVKRGAGSEDYRELYQSVDYSIRVLSVLILAYLALRLLRLWQPLSLLLADDLVTVGGSGISPNNVLGAALVMMFAVLAGRFVRALLVIRVFPMFGVDVGVGYAVQTLVNYVLVVTGFFVAMLVLGMDLSAMVVIFASLGVGIGFGLQSLTENLISGFILLFGRSVKKGDIITIGDAYGQVEAVGARSVHLKTTDNLDLLIPSKEIVGTKIVNWSYADSIVRLRLPVAVSYSADPRTVEQVLLGAVKKHDAILAEPAPEVWFSSFGDSSINFTLLAYWDCTTYTRDRLVGQLNFIVWDALKEAGISIPFPQRDLHLRGGELGEVMRRVLQQQLEEGTPAAPGVEDDAPAAGEEPG